MKKKLFCLVAAFFVAMCMVAMPEKAQADTPLPSVTPVLMKVLYPGAGRMILLTGKPPARLGSITATITPPRPGEISC